MREQLRRGALAGLAGGAALAVVLLVNGEGQIQRAIELEPAGGEEVFSRAGQRVGGVVAALLVGVAIGLAFAVAVTLVRRGQGSDSWRTPLLVATLAFVTLQVVPFLKYPPNPPGVGDSASVGRRSALYVLLLAWSVFSAWSGRRAGRWLSANRGFPTHVATPAAVATAVALILLAFALLPSGPSPDAVTASVVWSFRTASLGGWAAYWAVTGTVFAWLTLPAASRRVPHLDRVPVA